jgi:tetratricopeptide (TPR) repeat protein
MIKQGTFHSLVLIVSLCLFSSCATVQRTATTDDYRKQIAALELKLGENPNDVQALQELGIIYFQVRNYVQAKQYLKKASLAGEKDAKTLFYYGMTLEADSNLQAAYAVYIDYTDFSSRSPYRKLLEGRYRALTKVFIQQQVDSLVQQEQRLPAPTAPNVVAVFPLDYQGKDEKYSSLGKGLGELMLNDLGQVSSLKLVERIRVEALLDELRFAATANVDPATAPRFGKFLSAGRIVGGRYDVSDENVMHMDVTSYDIVQKQFPEPTTESDVLDNLFKMEKELIFGVIKAMGITLTKAEQEKIQRIPTKNIQSFIMYTKGLERESAGDFKAAEVYYKQAVSLDPDFSEAKSKADAIESLSFAGGSMESALSAAYTIDPPIPGDRGTSSRDLINMRIQNLERDLGTNVGSGIESRKPSEEAARTGAAVGDLPLPPKPPNR